MSTSVDQISKTQQSQGSNGPNRETTFVKSSENNFDAYTGVPQTTFSSAQAPPVTAMPNQTGDHFVPNYHFMGPGYYPPNTATLNDNAANWSNTPDPMNSVFYGNPPDYLPTNNGMYSNFNYSAGFGWDFPNYTYNNSSPAAPATVTTRQKDERSFQYSEFYGSNMNMTDYNAVNGTGIIQNENSSVNDINPVEQSLKSVSLNDDAADSCGAGENSVTNSVPQNVGGSSKKTWASIASQPGKFHQTGIKAKPTNRPPPPPVTTKNMDIGTWATDNKVKPVVQQQQPLPKPQPNWIAPRGRPYNNATPTSATATVSPSHPLLDQLKSTNTYNPKDLNLNVKGARFFIIKSYSEDDIHRSIKYAIWCSTEHGNKRLDSAFNEREGKGPVYLFFSVNGSGHFCGVAQMMSAVDYSTTSSVWAQDKWRGKFEVKWIYVKDVPNSQLRHIRLENNENKPVTNSRDTQEVPPDKGRQVLRIIHQYRQTTSIFDDFIHYENRQKEDDTTKTDAKESRDDRERSGRERRMNKRE